MSIVDAYVTKGLSAERAAIVRAWCGELGTGEVPARSNRGPCEKYWPAWLKDQYAKRDAAAGKLVNGPAWCGFFALWGAHRVLGKHILGAHIGSVWEMVRRAKSLGIFIELNGDPLEFDTVAAPGDIFCQLERPFAENDPCQGHCGGLVRLKPDPYDPWVTVDGNSDHRVRLVKRLPRGNRMRGVISTTGDFGRGDWARGWGGLDPQNPTGMSTR